MKTTTAITPIIVSPAQVPSNARLTIRSSAEAFNENAYLIKDELGRIIRKGAISKGINEFCLSVVGMASGVYRVTVGQVEEKFTVI
jgi:hypothetical protein